MRIRVRVCVRVRDRVCGNSIISRKKPPRKMSRVFAEDVFCSIIFPNNMYNMRLERCGLKKSSWS